jgi:hypothetical protein
MKSADRSAITPQLWLANILELAQAIANKENQEQRWLAPAAFAWERPEELLNSLDDVVLDGFIEKFSSTFSEEQSQAILSFQAAINEFCSVTPAWLDPAETLADPRWRSIRHKAEKVIAAFKGKWTPS